MFLSKGVAAPARELRGHPRGRVGATGSAWRVRSVERVGAATDEWRNFKLIREGYRLRKQNWWLGWNGERLARSADAGKLKEHEPGVYAWLAARLARL